MRTTLLCTVGTSLLANLAQLSENTPDKPDNWKIIQTYYDRQLWSKLARELAQVPADARIMGAEINTIEQVRHKNWLELKQLIFLVSDTDAGKNTGEILKHYFQPSGINVSFHAIEQLQDQDPAAFKKYGLRNLVRVMGEKISQFEVENIAIDATGGYKAQIAIAVLLGQALSIPVFYKHERFSEIIDFPPMPITLDYDIIGNNADYLSYMERGSAMSMEEFIKFDERLRVFMNEVEVDGTTLFELNAIGQLYLTTYRLKFPKLIQIHDLAPTERSTPTFGNDHHYPDGFKDYVRNVWQENPWIKTCFSLPYGKQKSIKDTAFYVKQANDGSYFLMGTFRNNNSKEPRGARFQLILSDNHRDSLNWAALRLNDLYG